MPAKRKITLAQMRKALKSKATSVRYNAMFNFARSDVTTEALPVLLGALRDKEPGVVRYAAECLGKIGPAALTHGRAVLDCPQVIWELQQAAARVDDVCGTPQAYTHCLDALLKLDPQNDLIVGLIHDHIGLTNWHPLKASLQALKRIGTPEALDLLKRAVAFWNPELDNKQKRIAGEILAGKYEGA